MNAFLTRIKRQLIADRRKLGAMVCLLAVALLLWGRLLLKDVPRTAVARPDAVASVDASANDGAAPSQQAADKNSRAMVAVQHFAPVQRDLFAFDPNVFPHADGWQGNTTVVDKSVPKPTDDSFRQQQVRLAVQAQARALTLQSTLLGGVSRAMINGTLLEVGQSIQGFMLKDVRSRAVTLEKDGVEVNLEM